MIPVLPIDSAPSSLDFLRCVRRESLHAHGFGRFGTEFPLIIRVVVARVRQKEGPPSLSF